MTEAVRTLSPVRTKPGLPQGQVNGKPGVNAKTRTWTSSDGTTFTLKKISVGAMERIRTNPDGKPRIPLVTVNYGNGTGTEPNPNDPQYIEDRTEWQNRNQYQAMLYTLGNGVVLDVPADVKKQHLADFPDATEHEIKYFYLSTIVEVDELSNLMGAILGQTQPTEGGIAEAEDSFPGSQ